MLASSSNRCLRSFDTHVLAPILDPQAAEETSQMISCFPTFNALLLVQRITDILSLSMPHLQKK
jgi:hypothetical protein